MEVTHSSPGKEGLLSLLAALPSLTAGSSRSLHNVTYVTYVPPDCPIPPGAGEAPRTAPPRPAAALTAGGKSCGVPLGIFPSGFWEGETSAQALCLRACACAKRREGEAPAAIARLPPRAWLPHAGAGQRRGELLPLLPFLTALLTGSFLSAPCASPVPFPPSFLSD